MEQTFDAPPLFMTFYAIPYDSIARLANFKVMWINMHFLVDVESVQNGFDIDFACFIKLYVLVPRDAVRIYCSSFTYLFQHRLELLEKLLLERLRLKLLLGIWIIFGINIMWRFL